MTILDRLFLLRRRGTPTGLDNADSSIFGVALYSLITHREALDIINKRQLAVSNHHRLAFHVVNLSIARRDSDDPRFTTLDLDQLNRMTELAREVRIEVESFYLFAKILLDEVARLLQYYFGPVRGLSLASHDRLVRHFTAYCEGLSLQGGATVTTAANTLKTDISDFRDYQVSHNHNLRTMHPVLMSRDGVGARILLTQIFQTETDKEIASKELPHLLATIDDYLTHVLDFIDANHSKTNLKLEPDLGQQPPPT
jgi:hypothetical protein